MGLKEILKSYIAISELTLTEIQNELNRRNGTSHGVQNLSKKINNQTLRYNEIEQIADILGYRIEWIKKENMIFNNNLTKEQQDNMLKLDSIFEFMRCAAQNMPPELIDYLLKNGAPSPEKLEGFKSPPKKD